VPRLPRLAQGARQVTLPRSRPWDGEGCFALDYLRSEGSQEPRRALVHEVKAGHIPTESSGEMLQPRGWLAAYTTRHRDAEAISDGNSLHFARLT